MDTRWEESEKRREKSRRENQRCVTVFHRFVLRDARKGRLVKRAGSDVTWEKGRQKVHLAVAKNTFASQNLNNIDSFKGLFEDNIKKTCMELWRNACLQVKNDRTPRVPRLVCCAERNRTLSSSPSS